MIKYEFFIFYTNEWDQVDTELLNSYGEEGWAIVSTTKNQIIFQRPKEN